MSTHPSRDEQTASFRQIKLSLPDELAQAVKAYHTRLQGFGMGAYKADTIRELLMIALSADPESVIPLADRAAVVSENRLWVHRRVRELLVQIEKEMDETPVAGSEIGRAHV